MEDNVLKFTCKVYNDGKENYDRTIAVEACMKKIAKYIYDTSYEQNVGQWVVCAHLEVYKLPRFSVYNPKYKGESVLYELQKGQLKLLSLGAAYIDKIKEADAVVAKVLSCNIDTTDFVNAEFWNKKGQEK